MTKRRIWKIFCGVLIFLLTCTVLSIHIETLMKINVETVSAVEDKEAGVEKIPLSCYQWDEDSFYYVDEREGLFGKELFAVRKERPPIYTEAEDAVLPPMSGKDEEGKVLHIVSEASWPIEDGDLVVLKKDAGIIDVTEQIRIFSCLAAIMLPGILLLSRSLKKFESLREGNLKDGIEGAVMVLSWLVILFVIMGRLEIPRQYLPPEYILDIPFYAKELRELNFIDTHKEDLIVSGVFMIGVWGAATAALYRKRNKNKGKND